MTRRLLSLVSIAGLWLVPACKRESGAKPVEQAAPAVTLAPEDILVVKRGTIQSGPRISGTLEPGVSSVMRAETGGTVVAIGPELGDRVKKGDLLARIESKSLGDVAAGAQSGVTAAQAQLDLARREAQRTEALVKGGAIAQRELDRAKSQVVAAEAAVRQARAQLSSSRTQLGDATVRAPIPGVIARRGVSVGELVTPGAELYQIIDPSTMRLDAAVASDSLSALVRGKTVAFEVRGYPGQKFEGKIARIAPAADPVTRQIQVLVDLPNPDGKLVAGLYAEGRVSVEEREGLVVPLGAVDTSGDQPSVLRAKNGIVERVTVGLGVRDDRAETVEVQTGIGEGDVLVLAHAGKTVPPGTKVTLPGAAPAPAPAPAAPAAPAPAGAPATAKPAAEPK